MDKIEKQTIAQINKYIRLLPDSDKRCTRLALIKYSDGTIVGKCVVLSETNGKVINETILTDEQIALFDWKNNVWGIQRFGTGWKNVQAKDNTWDNIPDMRGKNWLSPAQCDELGIPQTPLLSN